VKYPRTFILIADGSRARLVVSEGRGKPLADVPDAEFEQESRPTRELGRDRPGRVQESATSARHAVEQPDLHQREEERFAIRLAEMLDQRLAQSDYEKLVLVAAPEMLGSLRAALSEKVRAILSGEIAKNLTKIPNPEIRNHFPDDLLI
jgi:protein required for attachment to host cells